MSRMEQDLSSSLLGSKDRSANGDLEAMRPRRLPFGKVPNICIVGAGVAGLRCADILIQHGARVTILEARNRIGGRLTQVKYGNRVVDCGANWIHGTENNPILDLAKDTGTILHKWEEEEIMIGPNGKILPADLATEYSNKFWGLIAEAFKYSNDKSTSIPANESLKDFIRKRIPDIFPESHGDESVQEKRDMMLRMAEMWGPFVGSPVARQSLKFFWLEECLEGDHMFVADTYGKILDRIARPALGRAVIKLGHKVVKISSRQQEERPRVTVELSSSKTEEFDEVVMTAPLGWLKRNRDVFEPPVPARLSQAIDSIGYGCLDKVYITFSSAFWNSGSIGSQSPAQREPLVPSETVTFERMPSESLPSEGVSTERVQSSLPLSGRMTDANSPGPSFVHWLTPEYAESTNPHQWIQEGVCLSALPEDCAHPTLLYYTYGDCSQHIAHLCRTTPEHLLDEAILNFFEPYYSRLPNYDSAKPECKPTAVLATNWTSDELAGYGSYSNFQVGLEAGAEDFEVMRHGMPERGVWLAGEHTAPFVATGTVTGAYWSGEFVAKRIVKLYDANLKQ